ncbi:adhesion G-protein coupled receptor G2-like [Cyclopterus lumpus]|uniref:adhesion G-protein coupled receptor G2-like n=1 Tax=Cyclopterus lumpus TaxID=8103 RepID=UPI0014871CA7|nr:adhesion G-protein coupled receptor G2-like [Cyclopterus lumpus]
MAPGYSVTILMIMISGGKQVDERQVSIKQKSLATVTIQHPLPSYCCWILNLVYFIFIFNTGILIAVASDICKMKQVFRSSSRPGAGAEGATRGDPMRFGETCRSSLTVMALTCLMGITWDLAFLGSGYVNNTILYLFCSSLFKGFLLVWGISQPRSRGQRHGGETDFHCCEDFRSQI